MKPLRPILRTTLSEQVATQIGDRISAAEWKLGEKLPSEAELSQALGVSRATVREALKSLAFIGLVRMRTGRGTYVAGGSPAKFLDQILVHGLLTSEEDVRDLTDARMALETELVALCAERATDQDLDKLEQILVEMKRLLPSGGDAFLQLDLDFHLSVASFSKSRVLAKLLRTIRGLLQELIRKSAKFPGDSELTYTQHMKILKALKERNARKARTAMREHLRTLPEGYRIFLRASAGGQREQAAESGTGNPSRATSKVADG